MIRMNPELFEELTKMRLKIKRAGACAKALLDAAKVALEAMREESEEMPSQKLSFTRAMAQLEAAIHKAEGHE